MLLQTELSISTTGHRHIEDITGRIERIVRESTIQAGLVNVFHIGSTAALGATEFEPGLCQDLGTVLDRLIPPGSSYAHEQAWHDGNAHSHLQSVILGPSFSAPVRGGRLILGTWQQLFLLECDVKPRKRTLIVTVIGE